MLDRSPSVSDAAPRLRGVLRGADARLARRPFEVGAEWTADVPFAGGTAFADPDSPDVAADDEPAPGERSEAALDAARAEAYAAGLADGAAAGQADAEAARAELDDARAAWAAEREGRDATLEGDLAALASVYEAFLRRAEPVLAELAVGAAETLLEAPLPDAVRDATLQALEAAVERFGEGVPLTISLPPDDLARLRLSGVADHLERHRAPLRWHADAALEPGDWCLDADAGAVRRVRRELVAGLRAHLGLGEAREDD